MYVRKEAVLSSQIEGTQSSLQDLLAAEAQILSLDSPKDVDEVVNYVKAMKYGLERLKELPLSVRLIRELHQQLLQGVRGNRLTPGEIRTSQNWIGPAGCTLTEAVFVPPPPHEVPALLGALETFLYQGALSRNFSRLALPMPSLKPFTHSWTAMVVLVGCSLPSCFANGKF
jgi:Fic family protein